MYVFPLRSGELPLTIALKILQYIKNERSYVPFSKLMKEVQFMDKLLKNQPVYGKFQVSHVFVYYSIGPGLIHNNVFFIKKTRRQSSTSGSSFKDKHLLVDQAV